MPNRLIDATSPYLLQHAHNPVDWYEWGEEALTAARDRDVPILLSVGYSACHWCHVMERESFEDETTAAQMNRDFVCIKVDREERPDIDSLYMAAVQALQQRGGWPMTVFLTPAGVPYYGGTYFPPERRHGMPSFRDILTRMSQLYRDSHGEVQRVAGQLEAYLKGQGTLPEAEDALRGDWLPVMAEAAREAYDPNHAGFTRAPKFPSHGLLPALLAHVRRTGDAATRERVVHTLDAMAKGGMYDLIGGGFARYSVDDAWRVPHFEKMLYDNGQLVPVYLAAHQVTQAPRFARIARESLGWMARDMRLEHGGFAAATDADSEGVEGRYFAWTPDEIREVLGTDAERVCALLQVTAGGTFEHGTSVLRLEEPLEALAPEDRALLGRSFPKLLAERDTRVPPARDDKVVHAWNSLAISAFARAAFVLDAPEHIEVALSAARFAKTHLEVDGRLHRSFRDGKTSGPGFSDDYALWITAALDLYEATFDAAWIAEAQRAADALIDLFWDADDAGFFHVGRDAERLIARTKPLIGGAEPGANGSAALALVRLGRLCDRSDLIDRAEQILCRLQPLVERAPRALGPEAIAADWLVNGGREVGLVGDPPLLGPLRADFDPFRVVAHGPVVPWMAERTALDGAPTAYVCEGFTCQLPVTDPGALAEQLR